MKRLKKLVSTIGLVTIMISSSVPNIFAMDGVIYEKINKELITTGVTHQHILRFHKNGWLNANVVYINLDNEGIEMELLQSSTGLATKETLSSMVNKRSDVVAAINGDFFYTTTPDSPIGAMIKDGKVISSPVFVHDYATLSIDKDHTASVEYWDYDIYAATDKGRIIPITSINKYTHEYQSIMLIDKNWGQMTPGYNPKHYDMVEVIVVEDEVVEVRRQQPPTIIPENGYVILASQGNANVLFENFQVGDLVTVRTNIHGKNLENIDLALGGGTALVINGQVANFTQVITGNHPRTAVGITKDRQQLIMVTVDGRHQSYKGVDGQALAKLMIELGSHEAIVMDGGGSTTMIARSLGEFNPKLVNYPSDGGERRIINGLAVVSKAGETELEGIKVQISHNKSFVGVGREIAVKAFDKNYNPIMVDSSQLKYRLKSGEGNFVGNKFIPTKAGKTVIEVDYRGKKAEVTVEVLEELALLKATPESLRLSYGQTANLKLMGVDKNGYSTPIDAKEVKWKDEGGLGILKDGVYQAGDQAGRTVLTATLGNKTASIPVSIGESKVSLGALENYKFHYTGYPVEAVPGKVFLDQNTKVGQYSIGLEYDFTQTEVTRAAYVEFQSGNVILPKDTLKLGFWAYADAMSPVWIRGHVKDAAGTRHTIDFKKGIDWIGWKYLEANLPEGINAPVELERLYVVETSAENKVAGRVLFSGLDVTKSMETESSPIYRETIKDEKNTAYKTKGTQLFIHSGITFNGLDDDLKNTVAKRIQELVNTNYHMSVFTSSIDAAIAEGINKPNAIGENNYRAKEYEDNLIIQLNNRGGGLRGADYNQWTALMNQLNTTNKKNIFITLPRPIWGHNGFTDELEINLFKETLTKAAEAGKNVFVLYGGEAEVKVELVEGVRYISTGIYNNNDPKASKYIEFNILDNEVTYQIKPLF